MVDDTSYTHVMINSNKDFWNAIIEQYIDDNKPDQLSLKQLRGLSLDWRNNGCNGNDENINMNDIPFEPSHLLQGTLDIGGEYLVVSLDVTCAWSSSSSSSSSYGKLYYSCWASARFWTKSEWKKRQQEQQDDNNYNDDNNTPTKIKEKIRSKMIKRLQDDSYISKILINSNSSNDGDDNKMKKQQEGRSQLLAQAKIYIDETDLEERVDVTESICESIKRSIWSNAESQLDVIELILQFPCLPTTSHNNNNNSNNNNDDDIAVTSVVSVTTKLANRAKLRLLEDAMVDACEQEGEDQILEDLEISSKQQQKQKQHQEEEKTSSSSFNNNSNKNNQKKNSRKRTKT